MVGLGLGPVGIQWQDSGRDDWGRVFGLRWVGAGLLGLQLIAGMLEAGSCW